MSGPLTRIFAINLRLSGRVVSVKNPSGGLMVIVLALALAVELPIWINFPPRFGIIINFSFVIPIVG